jgi:3-phosphoglycerate kinase
MAPHFRTLADLPSSLAGERVLARFDWNVPLAPDGSVANDYRIRASRETLSTLLSRGAAVIAISHLGRKGESLAPVVASLAEATPGVSLVADPFSAEGAAQIAALQPGQLAVIENIRRWPEEEGNVPEFAQKLSRLGSRFVNDAFPVSHRAHASVDALPRLLPSYAGAQLAREVFELSAAFAPAKPFVFILGGAKFETKLPLLRRFQFADKIFLAGALLNDLLAAKGYPVGASLVSGDLGAVSEVLSWGNVVLPEKLVLADAKGARREVAPGDIVNDDERILDVGVENLKAALDGARFVLWNGPLGLCEEGYKEGTEAAARLVAECGATQLVGGGDTVAAIEALGLARRFSFVSTAGGAMLDFLASGGELPGLQALAVSGR